MMESIFTNVGQMFDFNDLLFFENKSYPTTQTGIRQLLSMPFDSLPRKGAFG